MNIFYRFISRYWPFLVALRYAGISRRKALAASPLATFISRLSMAGLILGVAVLVTVLSVMNGFEREMRERILGLVPHLTVFHPEGFSDWQMIVDAASKVPSVRHSYPYVSREGLAVVAAKAEPVALMGLPEKTPEKLGLPLFLKQGELALTDGVVIGSWLAEQLRVEVGGQITLVLPKDKSISVGKTFLAQASPTMATVKVNGIVKTGTELDRSLLLMSLRQVMALAHSGPDSEKNGKVDGVHLQVDSVLDVLASGRELMSHLPYGFYARDWRSSHGNLYHAIQMSKNMVGLLVFLIIAIAVFNVIASLVMVVVEKQGDIAVLKTLGASRKQVLAVFVCQGSLIGAIGTLAGLAIGVVFSLLIPSIANWMEDWLGIQFLKADVYPITYLPSAISSWDLIWVGGIALLMSSLATLYPAFRATRVAPANALRYE